MDVTGDELAGVVDLFGALTRPELCQALVELAYRHGEDTDPSAFEDDVDAALDSYRLVAADPSAVDGASGVEDEDVTLLVPGPVAFPELPDEATDLPHIMDVPDRSLDRATVGERVQARFRTDAEMAIASGDDDRVRQLLDVSYELEVWGPVDVDDARARLDDALQS
jgi:hypothetical protein